MKHISSALRMLLFMTVVTGIAYPLLVTLFASSFFSSGADGSLIQKDGTIVGSSLMAQSFMRPRYFWPRPSALGYVSSGGSNQGPTSADLKKSVEERRAQLTAANPGMGQPPQDLLFASGSGVDPDISPEAAYYQISRVAEARKIEAAKIRQLVDSHIEDRTFGLLGQPRVNVLKLNLALDSLPGNGG